MEFAHCPDEVVISWEDFGKVSTLFAVDSIPVEKILRCDFSENADFHSCHVSLLGVQVFTDKEGGRTRRCWWVSWGAQRDNREYAIFEAPMCDKEGSGYPCDKIMSHPGQCKVL